MGWERKRGKLADLNALLRERRTDGFSVIVGATAILSEVKYVITLDTDTQLPRDSARQFVGAMAHPLNAARFGERGSSTERDVVTSGYGILQPRVSMSLPGASRSRYARLHGGDSGVDPYTRAVSDVPAEFRAQALTSTRVGNVVTLSRIVNVLRSDVICPEDTSESRPTVVPSSKRTS